jgi:thioredoxin reductase (NADPH)
MPVSPILALYVAPLLAFWCFYALTRRRAHVLALNRRREAIESGLTEPVSLHPLIDPVRCIGCKACLYVCPERQVLALVGSRAEVVEPANCIGHGACKAACPTGAIQLVFGSETRGVELPVVNTNFETNVPGLYIAGELGGMGLIRNAIEQGRQAIESIVAARRDIAENESLFDVIIVGAGPAGISASLGALEHSLRFVTLEQDTLGGTVAHYPRGKIVMTSEARLPLVGSMQFKSVTKGALLSYWQDVVRKTGLVINTSERVVGIARTDGGFFVQTTRVTYAAQNVLLAIGRRGTPRQLGVPGEELSKVCYRLVDPAQYRGQNVLVMGGGDSAIEAAESLARQPGTHVVLAHRGRSFQRASARNRKSINQLARKKRVEVLLATEVVQILPDQIQLTSGGSIFQLPNNAVIICAGGTLPDGFLRSVGIVTEMKYGTA